MQRNRREPNQGWDWVISHRRMDLVDTQGNFDVEHAGKEWMD